MYCSEIVKLETKRLILRRFEKNDVEAMYNNWANDPDVTRFMVYETCKNIDETQERVKEWFEYFKSVKGVWGVFAVTLKTTGEIIGTIDFAETDSEARSAEVGYQLGKAWWGMGYAAEALREVLKYCFETIGLNRVWANIDKRNVNSGKVLEKAGMLCEGTKQCKLHNGEPASKIYYAMLAKDYFLQNKEYVKTFGYKKPNVQYKVRVGAYGIGFDDEGKTPVVMTHLYNGEEGYFLLGGGIDNNEEHTECIKRECLEEAGLSVTPRDFICKGDYYHFIEETKIDFHGIGYFYYMEINEIVSAPTEPDHFLVWLTVEEVKQKLFLPHQIWAVEKTYEIISKMK